MPYPNSKPKVKIICETCKKAFLVHPYRSANARFCSMKCKGKWQSANLIGNKAPAWRGGKLRRTCLNCGETYYIFKVHEQVTRFCSRACSSSYSNRGEKSQFWKGGKKTIACSHCNKEFLVNPGDKRRKYCSKECHDAARRKRVELVCKNCGEKYAQKLSKAKRYNNSFCSHECYSVYSQGENSHNWRGGLSFEPYPPTFNNRFKRMIRERDNYTCAICGKRGKCVHHINYVKNDTNPENCITLCRSCHTKTNSNREYWQEFFANQLALAL